jgi:uncharacterized protein
MTPTEIIQKTADYVRQEMMGEASGHDWWHVYRVWQTAQLIAKSEKAADPFVVELGALLHDIADWKFADGDLDAGPRKARAWLESLQVEETAILVVEDILRDTPFKGAGVALELKTIEAEIVFDADKLDAIGAIGIARAFAYGGNQNRVMYEPEVKPTMHQTFEAYKNDEKSHTINHFYEKLLLLKDLMQTETGKQLALRRHVYMEKFLEEFLGEWNGER